MKTFVSWSGERGRLMAQALCDWLPLVLPDAQPWMSTQIRRGSTWVTELLDSLGEADSCIVCVTSGSIGSSWLAFEAGMLSADSRQVPVVCVCLDVDPEALSGSPLGLLESVVFGLSGMAELVRKLDRTVPAADFEQSWPDLAERIAALPPAPTQTFELIFWTPRSVLPLEDTPLADGPWSEELERIVDSVWVR